MIRIYISKKEEMKVKKGGRFIEGKLFFYSSLISILFVNQSIYNCRLKFR